jgi:hypothetical protein
MLWLADVYAHMPAFINAILAFLVALAHLRFYRSGRLFHTNDRMFSVLSWCLLGATYTVIQFFPDLLVDNTDRALFRLAVFGIASTEFVRTIKLYSILAPLMEAGKHDRL